MNYVAWFLNMKEGVKCNLPKQGRLDEPKHKQRWREGLLGIGMRTAMARDRFVNEQWNDPTITSFRHASLSHLFIGFRLDSISRNRFYSSSPHPKAQRTDPEKVQVLSDLDVCNDMRVKTLSGIDKLTVSLQKVAFLTACYLIAFNLCDQWNFLLFHFSA